MIADRSSGEYVWNHRRPSVQRYLLDQVLFGATGLGNALVDGVFIGARCQQSLAARSIAQSRFVLSTLAQTTFGARRRR